MGSYQRLKIKKSPEGIATITLSKPDRRNAMDELMHAELPAAFNALSEMEDVRVIVLTGDPEGEAFCAGGDLGWVNSASKDGAKFSKILREGVAALKAIASARQPVIAMINGPAIGLGATIALFCDISYMAHEAVIADPHVKIGVVAGDGGSIIWPLLLGHNKAKEFLMTGDALTGTQAEAIGLVNHAVPLAELEAATYKMAQRLASGARLAIELTKRSVNMHLERTMAGMLEASLALEGLTFNTSDHDEAVRAFFAKEKPQFGKK